MNALPKFAYCMFRAAGVVGLALVGSVVAVTVTVAEAPAASTSDPSLVTFERIFKTKDFRLERFGPACFLDGGATSAVEG